MLRVGVSIGQCEHTKTENAYVYVGRSSLLIFIIFFIHTRLFTFFPFSDLKNNDPLSSIGTHENTFFTYQESSW